MSAFREILLAEIEKQKSNIKRMDFRPNPEFWDNGVMTSIRQERLDLLMRLLDFEPSPSRERDDV